MPRLQAACLGFVKKCRGRKDFVDSTTMDTHVCGPPLAQFPQSRLLQSFVDYWALIDPLLTGLSMYRRIHVVALLAAVALAACSTDVVSPEKAVAVSKFGTSSIASQSGKYIVLMSSTGIASGFAETVAKAGGRITYANAN